MGGCQGGCPAGYVKSEALHLSVPYARDTFTSQRENWFAEQGQKLEHSTVYPSGQDQGAKESGKLPDGEEGMKIHLLYQAWLEVPWPWEPSKGLPGSFSNKQPQPSLIVPRSEFSVSE